MAQLFIGKRLASPESMTPFAHLSKGAVGETRSYGQGYFDTNAHLIAFAAVYGFNKELEGDGGYDLNFKKASGKDIEFSIFQRHELSPYLYAIALHKKGDHMILKDENWEEFMKIILSYASGGFKHLREADIPSHEMTAFIIREMK
ncbi:MAG: hypothetical protein RL095_2132 [Verrucomicrobiota bacterium]|jgi:hypothetical protein